TAHQSSASGDRVYAEYADGGEPGAGGLGHSGVGRERGDKRSALWRQFAKLPEPADVRDGCPGRQASRLPNGPARSRKIGCKADEVDRDRAGIEREWIPA